MNDNNEITKIHPFDMYVMLNDASSNELIDIFKHADGTLTVNGTRYLPEVSVAPQHDQAKSMMTDDMWRFVNERQLDI